MRSTNTYLGSLLVLSALALSVAYAVGCSSDDGGGDSSATGAATSGHRDGGSKKDAGDGSCGDGSDCEDPGSSCEDSEAGCEETTCDGGDCPEASDEYCDAAECYGRG